MYKQRYYNFLLMILNDLNVNLPYPNIIYFRNIIFEEDPITIKLNNKKYRGYLFNINTFSIFITNKEEGLIIDSVIDINSHKRFKFFIKNIECNIKQNILYKDYIK